MKFKLTAVCNNCGGTDIDIQAVDIPDNVYTVFTCKKCDEKEEYGHIDNYAGPNLRDAFAAGQSSKELDRPRYTKFKDTCFQEGHPDHRLFLHLLRQFNSTRPIPGIPADECGADDVVILFYSDIAYYKHRPCHASSCFLAGDDLDLFIHDFSDPNQKDNLFEFDPDMVRGVNKDLYPFLPLLEEPIVFMDIKTTPTLPRTSL